MGADRMHHSWEMILRRCRLGAARRKLAITHRPALFLYCAVTDRTDRPRHAYCGGRHEEERDQQRDQHALGTAPRRWCGWRAWRAGDTQWASSITSRDPRRPHRHMSSPEVCHVEEISIESPPPNVAFGFRRHSCLGLQITEHESFAFLDAILNPRPGAASQVNRISNGSPKGKAKPPSGSSTSSSRSPSKSGVVS